MMDEYVLIRKDANGKVIEAQPLHIESLTIESDERSSMYRFTIRGYYDPIMREAKPAEDMPTGEAFLDKYDMPGLLSGPD